MTSTLESASSLFGDANGDNSDFFGSLDSIDGSNSNDQDHIRRPEEVSQEWGPTHDVDFTPADSNDQLEESSTSGILALRPETGTERMAIYRHSVIWRCEGFWTY